MNNNKVFEVKLTQLNELIPNNWGLAKFDDISDVTDYVANGSFASLKKNVKYYKNKNYAVLVRYTDHAKKWNGNYIYVDKHAFDFLSKSTLKSGDIVIANVGDPGQAFRVPDLKQPMTLGPNAVLILPRKGITRGYFFYFFTSPWGQELIGKITTGTAQKKFNKTGLRSIVIPIAPMNEQKRIVDKIEKLFSDLDDAEANLKKVQSLIKTYRQSVLKAAVTGELISNKKAKLTDCKIEDLIEDIRYGTSKKCDRNESKTPVLRIPNVVSGSVDLSDMKYADFTSAELKSLSLKKGDLLLVRSNGSVSLVGRTAIVPENAQGYAYAGYLIRLRFNETKVLPAFIHLYLNSPIIRQPLERQARSTSGVHNINSDEIKSISLKLPSIQNQTEIVTTVECLFSKIDIIEKLYIQELTRSCALRQSILKSAFCGQLLSQDPKDEPAIELLKKVQTYKSQVKNEPKGSINQKKEKNISALTQMTRKRHSTSRKSSSKN